MNMIRVGLIGAGFVGPAHVEALRRLGYVEVLALAGSDAQRARARADELGIPEACGDYRQLLANPRVTVIHNATPTDMHHTINRDALRAGKHVISEKPLALSAAEALQLVNLARQTSLVNAVDYTYRGYPLVQQMRALIAQGAIGTVWAVHGSYLQDWMLYPTDYNWRVLPERGGESRAMGDIGSHWCDLAQWVTGRRINRVMARLNTMLPTRLRPAGRLMTFEQGEQGPAEETEVRTEDYAALLFDMEGGATGSVTLSQVAAGRKNRLWIEVDGSEGSLAWDQEHPNELWNGRRQQANQILPRDPNLLDEKARGHTHLPGGHPEGWADALRSLFGAIYDYIHTDKGSARAAPDYPTFYDGLIENQLVECVLQSHHQQRWVEVPQPALEPVPA